VSDPRGEIIAACREIARTGLTFGTSGNVSVRVDGGFYVSPTGMAYETLELDDIPFVDDAGNPQGRRKPSSEWRFHADLYRARPDVGAVVHTHSRHATALACTGQGIPPFHYMIAKAGGRDIRCAPYATFGSQDLSNGALAAMEGRKACLLANHGVIATGPDARAALALAGEVENLAAQYITALQAGAPIQLLDDAEMARVVQKFETYGQQR
jgi:L-fuculose-phosphate aldolase